MDTYQKPREAPLLRPPSWAKISQADIDRMNQYRNAASQGT